MALSTPYTAKSAKSEIESRHMKYSAAIKSNTGLLSPGVPWQFLADQLTLFQPGGADYAHHINTDTPKFSDLSTALNYLDQKEKKTPNRICPFSEPHKISTKNEFLRGNLLIFISI